LLARQRPRKDEHWTYGNYLGLVRGFSIVFVGFLVVAFWFNGAGLLNEAWWVVVGLFTLSTGTLWLLYDACCTRLAWSVDAIEWERLLFRKQVMRLDSVKEIRFNQVLQIVTLIDDRKTKIRFSYSYRVGINDLLAKIDRELRARQTKQIYG
jgi:hypothetical protein